LAAISHFSSIAGPKPLSTSIVPKTRRTTINQHMSIPVWRATYAREVAKYGAFQLEPRRRLSLTTVSPRDNKIEDAHMPIPGSAQAHIAHTGWGGRKPLLHKLPETVLQPYPSVGPLPPHASRDRPPTLPGRSAPRPVSLHSTLTPSLAIVWSLRQHGGRGLSRGILMPWMNILNPSLPNPSSIPQFPN
jgi:hypothetical protein